jgi:Zn-dependent protease with chaperone function
LFEVAGSVLNVAFAFFNQFAPIDQAYNFVYPVNIVNGKRHIVILPRTWEKSLGDNLLFPLSTWEFTKTNAASHGETLQTTVDRVVASLLAPNENKELLNPPLAPIALFDNIAWVAQAALSYVLPKDELLDEEPLEAPKDFEYKMEVMKHSSINAFCVPGGKMVVFSGLIEELDHALQNNIIKESKIAFKDGSIATVNLEGVTREDVLAALIGHEMTHAASRHGFTLSIESLLNEISGFLELTSSIGCYLFSAFVSRKNEFECDVTGAYLASKAGYDPRGAIYLEELFLQGQPQQVQCLERIAEPLFSHPHGSKRLRAVFTAISTFAPESLKDQTVWTDPRVPHSYDTNRLSPALKAAAKVRENLACNTNL